MGTDVHMLRQKLSRMKRIVAERDCEFQKVLEERLSQFDPHVAQGHDLYSLQDLILLEQRGRNCALFAELSCLVVTGADHIRACPLCKTCAQWCAICAAQTPVFAFEVDNYHECVVCHTAYHRTCFKRAGGECLQCLN